MFAPQVLPRLQRGADDPEDVSTFTYDWHGAPLTASNRYARISRRYYSNGVLKDDRIEIDSYTGSPTGPGSFPAAYQFQLAHDYDLNGRRRHTYHPIQLSPGTDQTEYVYQTSTGYLTGVTDALGAQYGFQYETEGKPIYRSYPAGMDTLQYDIAGRLRVGDDLGSVG